MRAPRGAGALAGQRALARVVADYESCLQRARPQTGGRSYTTPTFRQFLRMLRQHRRLRARGQTPESDPGS